ncbi:type VII secretion target [Microbacterium sp. NPDC007973]|uniref:type VII secretion target n=1 Tax=Microbacterium sp. NPDC007973 TaxID=3364182 RepID=UPI0036E9471A
MRSFTVTPDNLRRAAGSVDATVHRAEGETVIADAPDLGHGELGTAVADLMQAMTGGWTEAVAQADDVASGLRESAGFYERSDESAQATITALARPS